MTFWNLFNVSLDSRFERGVRNMQAIADKRRLVFLGLHGFIEDLQYLFAEEFFVEFVLHKPA